MPNLIEKAISSGCFNVLPVKATINAPSTLSVRDARVGRDDKVWWRSEDGPELVEAIEHWGNIKEHPNLYQFEEPKVKITYVD